MKNLEFAYTVEKGANTWIILMIQFFKKIG